MFLKGKGTNEKNTWTITKSFDEIVDICNEYRLSLKSEFFVGNIKNLHRTGRISSIVAKIASVLNIYPILIF